MHVGIGGLGRGQCLLSFWGGVDLADNLTSRRIMTVVSCGGVSSIASVDTTSFSLASDVLRCFSDALFALPHIFA